MSDLDDLNKRVEEIYQVLIQNGQAEFLETYNIADKISRKVCLIALYTDFSNENGIKQDKQTSLLLMKFDIKNGFTWTTCLLHCLFQLPEIKILKVTFLCKLITTF